MVGAMWKERLSRVRSELVAARSDAQTKRETLEDDVKALRGVVMTILNVLVRVIDALP